jgi:hypothetical protein
MNSAGVDSPGKGGKTIMAENEKGAHKEDMSCCRGAFFMDMMGKMSEAKKSDLGVNCLQMMSQMKQRCCGSGEKQEEAKANPVPSP